MSPLIFLPRSSLFGYCQMQVFLHNAYVLCWILMTCLQGLLLLAILSVGDPAKAFSGGNNAIKIYMTFILAFLAITGIIVCRYFLSSGLSLMHHSVAVCWVHALYACILANGVDSLVICILLWTITPSDIARCSITSLLYMYCNRMMLPDKRS